MWTLICYVLILVVYIGLLTCQLIACHLTHSLIILTDAYINLYKILDVSLGIIHLLTQVQLGKYNQKAQGDEDKLTSLKLGHKLFGHNCTYNFKRLPILGSFVNGIFLAALLMSAAIEGIQTCFHASHSEGEPSPLFQHPATYPALLVGMAVVGLILQYLTTKAHEMCQIDLGSESLLDVRGSQFSKPQVLDAAALLAENQQTNPSTRPIETPNIKSELQQNMRRNSLTRHESTPSLPVEFCENPDILLKSLKVHGKQGDTEQAFVDPRSSNYADNEIRQSDWLMVRCLVSPVSLVTCALITYYVDSELFKEVADAGLTVILVVTLFSASYPSLKRTGMILLQAIPGEYDLHTLKQEILLLNPSILDISEVRVWALTPRSNRVATCDLILDQSANLTERQVAFLLRRVMLKFREANIKCSTIQPKFVILNAST